MLPHTSIHSVFVKTLMDPIANDLITELRCYEEALEVKEFCPWNTTTCWDEEITVSDAEYHQDFLAECN